MRFFAPVVVFVVAAVLAGGAYVLAGAYDVAASHPRWALTAWVLDETMEKSVRRHAASITVPPLEDGAQIRTGYQHYKAMCEMCHGAPGVEPSELARGLEPTPPLLYEDDDDDSDEEPWTAAELFWITKHGIKMTGMPAWGPTHTDKEIWAMVAFLEKLPHLTAQEYSTFNAAGGEPSAHHHDDADSHEHDAARELAPRAAQTRP